MKGDNLKYMENQEIKPKRIKIYRISEKEYAKSKRDRERLLLIKKHASKIVKITSQVK
jgi:hypothetical protein